MLPKDWQTVNSFDESLHSEIMAAVEECSVGASLPKLATFDADGTLWDTDLGEIFFRYQIAKCRLPGLPTDPWLEYHNRKAADYARGCLWLAQINAGQKLESVQEWAEKCFQDNQPFPVFEQMRRLIGDLKNRGFEIFIVTASIKWAVQPAAEFLGIPREHVIGMETKVIDGVITNEPLEPLPYAAGKAKAFLHRTKGMQPIVAAGNTLGDQALLECATGVRLAISAQNANEDNFQTEMKLQALAKANNWFYRCYRNN